MKNRNKYEVPMKKWRKWSERARFVFNEVYGSMKDNAWAFQHPSVAADAPKAAHWKTTAWNASWIAADAADNLSAVSEVVDIDVRKNRELGRREMRKAA
jgi:hypothetical protein